MAQIITYPKLSTLANNDLLIVSDISSVNKTTNSLEVDTLAQHIIVTNNVITGGGTLRQIPMFSPTGAEISDSIMRQSTGGGEIQLGGDLNVTGNAVIDNDLTADRGSILNDLSVGADLSVNGLTETGTLIVNSTSEVNGEATFSDNVLLDAGIRDNGGSFGTAGQVLSSTGSGVQWTSDGGGTVTNIATTAPITGGPITTTGTIGITQATSTTDGYLSSTDWNTFNNKGNASGTGTTNTLPLWSDGPAGVLGDSPVVYDPLGHAGAPTVDIVLPSQTFEFRDVGRFITGAMSAGNTFNNATLDVAADVGGKAATFRGGVIVSTNPGGVQVDNTSMVIGGGNNDNVSGSDHCLIVGNGNQITSNSDQSVAFGQGNSITNSNDAFAVGNSNTLSSSLRTQALGFNNTIQADSSFIAGGDNNISTSNSNIMVLGYDNSIPSGNTASAVYILGGNNQPFGSIQLNESFGIGNFLTLRQNVMTLGYRNNASGYPAADKNLGLGDTKFVVGVGSSTTTNANALIITEGGINGGSSGSVPQVPRIIFPSVVGFNFADDTAAAAGGIPVGGLYHNAGALRIRLT